MKRIISLLLVIFLLPVPAMALEVLTDEAISVEVPSAILMEKTTGTIIYEKNAHEKLPPASVTKVMTLLLVVEEIEKGALSEDDLVTASARAASMGGSQIYLKEGEQFTVREMLKSVAVSSANDCAVALAEHIAGTEEAFTARMNERAAELGMVDTFFADCTGLLENPNHLTTAYDIALMSRELISHDLIKNYTTIWMDTVRNGEFGLSNTNKLIHGFDGATGLKTGFTSKAMYCLSATAERDGVEYIAVVLRGETSDIRFNSARTLLNYAFANYGLVSLRDAQALPPVTVELGKSSTVQPVYDGPEGVLLGKGELAGVTYSLELAESVKAPVKAGLELGSLTVLSDGKLLAEVLIVAGDDVERLGVWEVFLKLCRLLTGGEA